MSEIDELVRRLRAGNNEAAWDAARAIEAQAKRITGLETALKDCSNELESRLDHEYKKSDGTVISRHKFNYERDIQSVRKARDILNNNTK